MIEKYSPSTIEWATDCPVNFRFIFSLNSILYEKSSKEVAGISVSKFPKVDPLIVFPATPVLMLGVSVAFIKLKVEPSLTKTGVLISEKLKSILPFDSFEFKIPSLSKSRSRLSIIPSLSESSGHIETTISGEKYSALLQDRIPFKI